MKLVIIMGKIRVSVRLCLVFGTFVSFSTGQTCLSKLNEISTAQKLNGNKIVYDLTENVNNLLQYQSEYASNILDLYNDSSRYIYYSIETEENKSISASEVSYLLPFLEDQMIGVSFFVRCYAPFLLTLKQEIGQQHLNYSVLHERFPPETVIYRVTGNATAKTCDDYCPNNKSLKTMSNFLYKLRNQNIQVGLEYNNRFKDCCGNNIRKENIPKQVNVAILNIEFDLPISLLSYTLLVQQLNRLSKTNRLFCKQMNKDCVPYLHIKVPTNIQEFSKTKLNMYRAYVSDYIKTWSMKTKDAVIIDSLPENVIATPVGRSKYQNIHPVLLTAISNDGDSVEFVAPCNFKFLMKTVGKVAENLHLNVNAFTGPPDAIHESLISECKQIRHLNLTVAPIYPFLHMSIGSRAANTTMDTVNKLNAFRKNLVKRIYLDPYLYNSSQIDLIWEFMLKNNISIGCRIDMVTATPLRTFIDDSFSKCNMIFKQSPIILLSWTYFVEHNNFSYLNKAFEAVLNVRTEFQKIYHKGEIVLYPELSDRVVAKDTSLTDPEDIVNIYCTEYIMQIHSFKEIIATWAQIYNFTVNLEFVISSSYVPMWNSISIDNEVDRSATKYMLLIRRNIPEMIESSIEFSYTYPCLEYTTTPNFAIKFNGNSSTGISINTNLKPASLYTSDELQVLLLYCFGRFSSVEIKAVRIELLDILADVLTSEFTNVLPQQLNQAGPLRLYLEIKGISSLEGIINIVKIQKSNLAFGLHLLGWKHYTYENRVQLSSALESYMDEKEISSKVTVGLSVENCLQEMNLNLENLNAFSFISHISYVVCNVKPVFPTNEKQENMQLFLDTNFYVKQFIKERLNKSVIFRLNFDNTCSVEKSDIENYLKFLNDVMQHAEAYGVYYFMGEAFSKIDDFKYSWWQISDINNLENDAIYTELESEYFGRDTTRTLKIQPKFLKDSTSLIIGLSVTSLFFVITTGAIFTYYRKMRSRFLTKAEIYIFRKGVNKMQYSDGLELYDIKKHEAEKHPFQDDFEISKESIQLGDVVGSGNFGIVYKGTLKTNQIVAVKTPPSNCSKETFKTMLAEVKILCFIGLHPNVLRFVGAYTKEIKKGFIYIVTEFCEHGCLEKYLRSRKVTTVANDESSGDDESLLGYARNPKVNQTVEMKELYRFSSEIASGMDYLCRRKVIHGDLSTRNVLLTSKLACKIGDFGLSRKLYNKEKYVKQSDEELPWKWMAIEPLKRMEFTAKSDVCSFGVTLWEIFTLGDIPYHGMEWTENFSEKLEYGLRLSKPPIATEETYTKMLQCWNISPDKRPQFLTLASYFYEKVE